MKYTNGALALLSATGALAAPARRSNTTTDVGSSSAPLGFILPQIIKTHDIESNLNAQNVETVTVRKGDVETSTLYEIPVPDSLAGNTCGLVIFAGKIGSGDEVSGEQALDIFNNNIDSLAGLAEGNFRNEELARVRFNATTALYDFDDTAVTPKIAQFPCPAGKTLEWESVAVGEVDVNVIQQDFSFDGHNVPNGLSIAFW